MGFLDEIIEKIVSKDGKRIVFKIFILICSAMCAIVTQNIWLALIYLFATSVFDVLSEYYKEFRLDVFINWVFKCKWIYVILITIAFLPTLIWGVSKVIEFSDISLCLIKQIFVERVYNLVPNIFGALIVCSFIRYLSKLGADKILCAMIRLKKEFFDIIMRCGFTIAFLNAINHAFRNGYQISEWFNALHLTVIIFLGIVVLGAYALWIIKKDILDLENAKIYPTFSLVFCALFLWSCIFFPVKLKNVPIEWLLLFFNGVTSVIVAWTFLIFIRRKMNNESAKKKYPYIKLSIFTAIVVRIIKYGIDNVNIVDKSSIIKQLISGIVILLGAVVLLYFIDDLQKRNYRNTRKQLDLEKLKDELSAKQNNFKCNMETGLEFDYYESKAINDLVDMIKLKSQIEILENYLDTLSHQEAEEKE